MKPELRNIKYAAFASEETHCYEAALFVDGKPLAIVSNDGNGGCDMQHQHPKFKGEREQYRQQLQEVEAWLQANGGDALEFWCAGQVEEFLIVRDLRKVLKKKVLGKKPDSAGIYEWRPTGASSVQDVINAIKHKIPGVIILNEMPEAEAVALYRDAA